MKSGIALLLSFVFFAGSLFPFTDVEEAFKIPNLISHYFEHTESTTKDLSVWEFLQLHYGLNSSHAKSHHTETDHSLPMFHSHCIGLTFVMPRFLTFPRIHPIALTQFTYSFYQNTYAYLFSISFLRPPRY
ncbi:hypothetical protein QNI16_11070 [Cytophagaceae bacterium YF14B1]|uniref:Uncharacterized protein n=1 Tax=Xanthocytophaga flava TaxID=3048013 RepID=A0AAE3QP82_9BACT|nr:hypothetical protein [Xanthocytophaga flavus]MDJ1469175.1 hypothetical protein [Xanthocytophaga flavus]MDJ1481025.1 hypothetical protein [Xanthocytophaga flavus]